MDKVSKYVVVNRILSLIFMVTLSMMSSCSVPEPEQNLYEVSIKNASGHPVSLSLFLNSQVFDSISLNTSEAYSCTYSAENFVALRGCDNGTLFGVDSLRIVFPGNVGYVCKALRLDLQEFCLSGNLITNEGDPYSDNGNNQFEFILTPNDFLNAFSLE